MTRDSGLGMKEVVGNFTGEKLGTTFFQEKKTIDEVWATSDVVVVGACIMPEGYGVSDHRLFVIDFMTLLLIGTSLP